MGYPNASSLTTLTTLTTSTLADNSPCTSGRIAALLTTEPNASTHSNAATRSHTHYASRAKLGAHTHTHTYKHTCTRQQSHDGRVAKWRRHCDSGRLCAKLWTKHSRTSRNRPPSTDNDKRRVGGGEQKRAQTICAGVSARLAAAAARVSITLEVWVAREPLIACGRMSACTNSVRAFVCLRRTGLR